MRHHLVKRLMHTKPNQTKRKSTQSDSLAMSAPNKLSYDMTNEELNAIVSIEVKEYFKKTIPKKESLIDVSIKAFFVKMRDKEKKQYIFNYDRLLSKECKKAPKKIVPSQQFAWTYQHGKPLVWLEEAKELPTQMHRFHDRNMHEGVR